MLSDKSFIFVFCMHMRATEWNTITVYVKWAGMEAQAITLPEGSTIGDALIKAGFSEDAVCRVKGELCKARYEAENDDVIVVETWKVTQG